MSYSYVLSPSVGVARLGNSHQSFYLSPTKIGGLPRECDMNGNEMQQPFTSFRDQEDRIKRQAQDFRIYRTQNQTDYEEVTLNTEGVQSIEWTVHLANKKATWYQFHELQGNLLLGENNSYANQKIPLRNAKTARVEDRRKLIIDPGPRVVSGRKQSQEVARDNIPADYKYGSFPNPRPLYGSPINSLGTIKTDNEGRLLVLGAYGNAGGDTKIESYGGADAWFDDIADGPVNVTVRFTNGDSAQLNGWVICASPDFAPEVVNISTLDDTMFDVAVRHFNLMPDMYSNGSWNEDFVANYRRDILPIIERISRYQWVANVQAMNIFSSVRFAFEDPSEGNAANRQHYFSYFRKPTIYTAEPGNGGSSTPSHPALAAVGAGKSTAAVATNPASVFSALNKIMGGSSLSSAPTALAPAATMEDGHAPLPIPGKIEGDSATLFSADKIPMMVLNSGSNSVSNANIEKFLTLNQTQYFLLKQWARGKFVNEQHYASYPVWLASRVSVGNCVGLPMCPGIEVTWSMQNPSIYREPYVIASAGTPESYKQHGLTPLRDETEGGGCEPGDLTKRMAIPWQADFFNCTIQYINFTDPTQNKADRQPLPPTYYAYWWPPQAPWDVISGVETVEEQEKAHVPAGLQVNYLRGINSYVQMVTEWSYLGFIRNQNSGELADTFPYMVETERRHEYFAYKAVPVSQISGNEEDGETTIPVFYSKPPQELPLAAATSLLTRLTDELFQQIEVAEEVLLELVPRSGTRDRF